MYEKVKKFHTKYGQPVGGTPHMLSFPNKIDGDLATLKYLHARIIQAIKADPMLLQYRGYVRLQYKLEEIIEWIEAKDVPAQFDAELDQLYFTFGDLVEMGVNPEEGFEEVQTKNMIKVPPSTPGGKVKNIILTTKVSKGY